MSTPWRISRGGRNESEIRIGFGSPDCCPQYAVLHTHDSYLRFNYGPGCVWGTSVVTMPIAWVGGVLHQGISVETDWTVAGDNLLLRLKGMLKGLTIEATVMLQPPMGDVVTARVDAVCSGRLNVDFRPGEAFKPVFLSSMHLSDLDWDCCSAFVGDRTYEIPTDGRMVPSGEPHVSQVFGLNGGTSRWKKNGPTVGINLDRPLQVGGWVTPSVDPNDDNVGLWAASEAALPRWSYVIRTESGRS